MRRKDSEKDAIGVAKVYKIGREVAAAVVKDQKSPSSSCSRSGMTVEHFFELGKPEIIVRPSRRRVSKENLVLFGLYVVNPARLNPRCALVDESRR
jgi:hypothetical protein